MSDKTVLILGCTSWIGFKLSLKMYQQGYSVIGTSRTMNLGMTWLKKQYANLEPPCIQDLIDDLKPNIIINLLRGEDIQGWNIFRKTVRPDCYYVYLSSSLALDGYGPDVVLTDDLEANSLSPYGMFKSKCEKYIKSEHDNYLIVRINSIHGFAPHKNTRTQLFLEKLKAGTNIIVDTGVVQSRLYDEDFKHFLLAHIKKGTKGTIHFASNEKSEEIDFLKKLATTFGYTKNNFIEGERRSLINGLEPSRLMFLDQSTHNLDDSALLDKLKLDKNLKKYIRLGDQ